MKKRMLHLACCLACVASAAADDLTLHSDNIPEIVKALTIEEKAKLLVGRNDYTFGGYDDPSGFVRFIAPSVSGYTQGVPRLGIPPTALADGPAGAVVVTRPDNDKSYYATGFPSGSLLASSWNTDMVERVGAAIGYEAREYGVDVILAPGMNIMRSPLCGRNYEYFSEDPVVTGKIAAAYVRGLQNSGVGASLKHYAVNSQETNRTEVDEIVDQRALREIYLKGFEIAVKEAQPWTVMASYNRLNGPYTQENHELLTTVLRDEWGFDGIVMTDWIQQRGTDRQIKAGVDNLQPGYQVQDEDILAMVQDGRLAEADIDRAVERMLRYIVKTPHFKQYKYSDNPDLDADAKISREAATEGMVLLKNAQSALPISPDVKKVALFGAFAYDFLAGGTGSGNVVKPYVVNMHKGLADAGYELDDNLKNMYAKYRDYVRARSRCDRDPNERWYVEPPMKEMAVSETCVNVQADNADMAVIVLGRQAGEGGDRTIKDDFNISGEERALISDVCDAFHAKGKKVVVVLNTGGPMETASWKSLPDAILLAWQPGQEGGNAVADVLTGKVNPSGKLAMTFPLAAMDVPSSLNFPVNTGRGGNHNGRDRRNIDYTLHSEGIDIGYRYFSTAGHEVSYPFGYGLSYTDFAYSKPGVRRTADGFIASVTVTNKGKVAGKESVQLYVTAPDGNVRKPAIELKAFAKTKLLAPGESECLTMEVKDYDLASFDVAAMSWVCDAGKYEVKFGAAADDIRAASAYTLPRARNWKVNDVLRPTREL